MSTLTLPEGWLTEREAEKLAELAKDKTVLEVGAWLGRSTVALASTARLVVSVDHHRGSPEHQGDDPEYDGLKDPETGELSTLRRFLANLDHLNLRHKVIPVLASFGDAAPILGRHCFDLVFLDAAHSTATVRNHADLAWALAKVGQSWVVFHDYVGWESVRLAVDAIAKPDQVFESMALVRA